MQIPSLSDFTQHNSLSKDVFLKWILSINLDNSRSLEDWANQFIPELCQMLSVKAALFYEHEEKKESCVLKAYYQVLLSDKLPRKIKVKESNLENCISKPQIQQFTVNHLSAFYYAGDLFQNDTLLIFPIHRAGKVFAYIECLLNKELNEKQLNFCNKLSPFLAAAVEKVVNEEKSFKRVKELESINMAMEASQEAMHENAVKFMRIHQKLTASINYAQKMQNAILPQQELLSSIFEDFFVIYEPKDTVSGDFYWYSQIEYTFLAVIDCTGHGVPGAFIVYDWKYFTQ